MTLSPDQFETAYRDHFSRVAAWLNARTSDPDLADYLTQDAFIQLWDYRDRYRDESVSGLVFTMARHALSHHRRAHHTVKRGRGGAVASLDRVIAAEDGRTALGDRLAVVVIAPLEDLWVLADALSQLDCGQRWLLWQAAIGYDGDELAARYGTTKHAIEARLYRIRARLRRAMEGDYA